jgi:hypothetical protein
VVACKYVQGFPVYVRVKAFLDQTHLQGQIFQPAQRPERFGFLVHFFLSRGLNMFFYRSDAADDDVTGFFPGTIGVNLIG